MALNNNPDNVAGVLIFEFSKNPRPRQAAREVNKKIMAFYLIRCSRYKFQALTELARIDSS